MQQGMKYCKKFAPKKQKNGGGPSETSSKVGRKKSVLEGHGKTVLRKWVGETLTQSKKKSHERGSLMSE